jgi:hypothetical protein
MTAFRLELRRSRGLVLWLGITLFAYGGIMGLMHPILQENDDLMREYMTVFPKEFMAAFGMTGTLSDPGRLLHHVHRELVVADHRGRRRAAPGHASSRRRSRPRVPRPAAGDPHLAGPVPGGLDLDAGRGHGGAVPVRGAGDVGRRGGRRGTV